MGTFRFFDPSVEFLAHPRLNCLEKSDQFEDYELCRSSFVVSFFEIVFKKSISVGQFWFSFADLFCASSRKRTKERLVTSCSAPFRFFDDLIRFLVTIDISFLTL